MTDGIATLSLESDTLALRRNSAHATRSAGMLRQYVLGPENSLVSRGIGLSAPWAGEAAAVNLEYVPLTVYGPAGYGKSLLLDAVASAWTRQHSADSLLLTTGADFARSYATAIKLDDLPRFQQRCRRAGLLLLDDLEQLRHKPGAQQQLATMIEHRQRHVRPIILTASQPLASLELDMRLTSRLSGGLVVPLQLPASATRQVIVQRLCEQRQLQLTPEARRLLSEGPDITVPQLMGLISQLRHRRLGDGGQVTVQATDVQLVLQATTSSRLVDAKEIIRTAARFFGLQPRNLTGSSRRKMDVLARSQAMYLIRELTGSSFQQIGHHFGGRDHTTVMHACNKVTRQQQTDAGVRHALQEVRRQLSVSVKQDEPG